MRLLLLLAVPLFAQTPCADMARLRDVIAATQTAAAADVTGIGGRTGTLAYKWHGKTVTQALPNAAAVRKAEQEIAEFRNTNS